MEGIKYLGLKNITHQQVAGAIKELYPNDIKEEGLGEVIRVVFVHLQRKHTGDNVER